jgi:RimJ/RimL family protein N-acetyltransferase
VELRPLGGTGTDQDLLRALEEQEDVWEFIGTLPMQPSNRLFAVVEGAESVGIAGLVPSQAAGAADFELLCAMKSEVQARGLAKQACRLVLDWAFDTAKLDRIIACIDEGNEAARAIASTLGMQQLTAQPPGRTVYVKYRKRSVL